MSQIKQVNWIYFTPAHLIIGIFMPLALPFLIYALIRQKKWNPREIKSNEAPISYFAHNIGYFIRRDGDTVTQEWVILKYMQDKDLKGKSPSEQRKIIVKNFRDVKTLNKDGVRATFGNKIFPGKITYKLSPDNTKEQIFYTKKEWDELINLWRKYNPVYVYDKIDTVLSPDEWNRAYFRTDLLTGIDDFTQEEGADLFALTYTKLRYQESIFGDSKSSSYEEQFNQFYENWTTTKKQYGDYIYEFQLESHRENLPYPKELDNVLGDQGVHVGGNWFFKGQGHFLTIGKTRGGKGTNLIIPQLLNPELFNGSVISLDIKGTLTAITARYLKESGKKVVIIDPWGVQDKLDTMHGIEASAFNPLDALDPDNPNFIDDCDEMADLLVSFNKDENQDSHWSDRAKQWVSYYLMWMVTSMEKEDINLSKLREMFTYDKEQREKLFAKMVAYAPFDLIAQNGRQLADMYITAPKESQSIVSTIMRAIDLFKSPIMQNSTSHSDFDLKEITNGDYYVFVIIPPDRVKTHFRWLRAVLGGCITAVTRNANERVLMILDEFPSLGKLDLAKKGMGTMAEYNLSLWVIAQGIDQLKEIYGDGWQTFFTNSAVSSWVGIEGLETAEFLSRSFGTRHVKYKPDKVVIDELKKNVIHPPENYELPNQTSQQIRQFNGVYTLVSGYPPTTFPRTPYYESEKLASRAEPNPYYRPEE